MYCTRKVQDDLYYIGGNNHRLALFENIFPIPGGVTYNSCLLLDEKTALFDSVDRSTAKGYLRNVGEVLDGRRLDYMAIHHMGPDHAGAIDEIVLRYPNIKIVSSEQGFRIMRQIGCHVKDEQSIIVKEGDTISFGRHEFLFLETPVVHWPEVILGYNTTTGTLFSADAFGSFGALDGKLFNDEVNFERDWLDDAHRYYTNIIGKYGPFVEDVLKKTSTMDIKMIRPLHGPVWGMNIAWFIDKYVHRAAYEPKEEGVVIAYTSMYGNTGYAAQAPAPTLCERGMTDVIVYDVSSADVSQLISETFRLSHLVLASVAYNLGIYPKMKNLLVDLEALNVQNRIVVLIENGSWAYTADDKTKGYMDGNLRMFDVLDEHVALNTSLNEANENNMNALADSTIESMKEIKEIKKKSAE